MTKGEQIVALAMSKANREGYTFVAITETKPDSEYTPDGTNAKITKYTLYKAITTYLI